MYYINLASSGKKTTPAIYNIVTTTYCSVIVMTTLSVNIKPSSACTEKINKQCSSLFSLIYLAVSL